MYCYLLFFSLSSTLTSLTLRIVINYIFIIILFHPLSIHTRFNILNNDCTFICKVTSIFNNFCCFNSICKIFSFGSSYRVLLKKFNNHCVIVRKLSTTITSSIKKISFLINILATFKVIY